MRSFAVFSRLVPELPLHRKDEERDHRRAISAAAANTVIAITERAIFLGLRSLKEFSPSPAQAHCRPFRENHRLGPLG
jgi:hypothetical protein